MTTAPARAGLLRGLAARALGQERPLRSQRAVAVELGAGAIPVHDDPPRPLAHVSDEPAAVGEQLSALARPAQPAVRMPPVPAGIVTPTLATPPLSLAGDPAATAGVAQRGPKHGEPAIDYVAKPDYHFEYGVKDEKSKVSQSRKEARQGDEVIGEYR